MTAPLLSELDRIVFDATRALSSAASLADVEAVEIRLFGRKHGELTTILKTLASLTPEEKKTVGSRANEVRLRLELLIADRRETLEAAQTDAAIDVTEPVVPLPRYGALHPITQVSQDLQDFFLSQGFLVLDGPELETDFYNFEALNVPSDHPARDMQDTFYIKNHPALLMRTHTSGMQVRALEKYGAPLAAIVPGRVFRNEATDVRHEHTFHQLEGIVVDEHITLAHLKGVLEACAQHLYGPKTRVRLRPKYYPFVEPGMNGEVTCSMCSGAGCKLCKMTGWLEIFGCGMVHPHVLRTAKLNPEKVGGFAFGLGLTRIAMLKFGISDVRAFNAAELNFLQQTV